MRRWSSSSDALATKELRRLYGPPGDQWQEAGWRTTYALTSLIILGFIGWGVVLYALVRVIGGLF